MSRANFPNNNIRAILAVAVMNLLLVLVLLLLIIYIYIISIDNVWMKSGWYNFKENDAITKLFLIAKISDKFSLLILTIGKDASKRFINTIKVSKHAVDYEIACKWTV